MTEVALRVVAEAQDRASATLKSFRGEVDRNTESLRKMQKEARTNAEVESLFIRNKQEKLTAMAEERRKAVTAARAAAAEESSGFDKVREAVEGAAKEQGFLNKVLGIGGFIGAAAGAVSGVIELASGLNSYKDMLEPIKATQERFNELLADFEQKGRDFELGLLSEDAKKIAEAGDDLKKLTDLYLEFHAAASERDSAVLNLNTRIAKYQADIARDSAKGTLSASARYTIETEMLALQREMNPLADKLLRTRLAEEKALALIADAQERANWPLQMAKNMAADLSGSLASAEKFAGGVGDALAKAFDKVSWDPFKSETSDEARKRMEAEKKKSDAEREAAGKRGASMAADRRDREQALADQLAKARAGFEAESDYERKLSSIAIDRSIIEREYRAKKLSDTERQLKLQMTDLELMTAIREENERVAAAETKTREEAEQTAQKRIAERRKQSEEKLKESKEARTQDLDARAKSIEGLGEAAARADAPLAALSGRLVGLGSTIRETAGIWASYTRGQTALGDAIAGTIGTIGAQVAQAISDRRAQALVEGGFETAASIASFASGNIPAGIGHASAASSFFALAAQGGGKGAAAGGGSGRGAGNAQSNVIQGNFGQRQVSSRQEDQRIQVIHHYGQGIIFGLGADVARAGANADRSLNGTGMQNTGY